MLTFVLFQGARFGFPFYLEPSTSPEPVATAPRRLRDRSMGPVIAGLSLESGTELRLRAPDVDERYVVLKLPPRSLPRERGGFGEGEGGGTGKLVGWNGFRIGLEGGYITRIGWEGEMSGGWC